MRDINFFSVYKVARAKAKDVTLLIILGVFILGGLVGLGVWSVGNYFLGIQKEIDQAKAYIDSAETNQKLAELDRLKKEVVLLESYEDALAAVDADIAGIDTVHNRLLDFLASKLPATTVVSGMSISGTTLYINCIAKVETDSVDILHAFRSSGWFDSVSIASIVRTETGVFSFTVDCILKEGGVS